MPRSPDPDVWARWLATGVLPPRREVTAMGLGFSARCLVSPSDPVCATAPTRGPGRRTQSLGRMGRLDGRRLDLRE